MPKLIEVIVPPLDGTEFVVVWLEHHGLTCRTCSYHGGVGKRYLEDTAEWIEDDSGDWDDKIDAKFFVTGE